jgi:hypothetical protein
MGEITLSKTTMYGEILMLVTITKILATTTITNKNRGRTTIFGLTSLSHYVVNLAITLTIPPNMKCANI